jgi:hypothetical protein
LISRAYRRLSQSLNQRVTGLCAVGLSILRSFVVLANPLPLPRDLNLTPRPGGHTVTLAQFEGCLSWFISAKADACGGGCIFCVLAIRGPSADPDDDVRELWGCKRWTRSTNEPLTTRPCLVLHQSIFSQGLELTARENYAQW